jgi:hypothetical protein
VSEETMKADVLDAIGEVIEALTAYSDRQDREVELLIRADGTACLMGAEAATLAGETATGFEEIATFDSFMDLWAHLVAADVDLPEDVEADEELAEVEV